MKLTPYREALARDKKEAEAAAAEYHSRETEAKLRVTLVQIDAHITAAQSAVNDISSDYPLDSDSLCSALDELALLERKKTQLSEIYNQLFPDAKN